MEMMYSPEGTFSVHEPELPTGTEPQDISSDVAYAPVRKMEYDNPRQKIKLTIRMRRVRAVEPFDESSIIDERFRIEITESFNILRII